eukprot:jgi/Bigna1/84846/estExt_fgenesh1_pg.C_10200
MLFISKLSAMISTRSEAYTVITGGLGPADHSIFGAVWIYYSFRLAGFAFTSEFAAKTVAWMHCIVTLWSTGRLLRGTVLLAGVARIEQLSPVAYSMVMVLVLLATEFLPIIFTLDFNLIEVLLHGEVGNNASHPLFNSSLMPWPQR